nr:hypothetical protein [Tanacetum cinerariifolium]
MRYIKGKPNGKFLKKSVEEGSYELKVVNDPDDPNVVPPRLPSTRLQTNIDFTIDERKQVEADAYEIYSSVDCCK